MTQPPREEQFRDSLRKSAHVIQDLNKALYNYREPIAIVGMACRFPGPKGAPTDTPEAYWQLLQAGKEAIGELPSHRVRQPKGDHAEPLVLKGGFLEEVETFDAAFFGISPREALLLDPQQRLLLEVSWEALEAAHILPATLVDCEAGVFVGIYNSDYIHMIDEQADRAEYDPVYTFTGNLHSVAAGRVAYLLGLTGPAVAIDTACSSSLVALHQACQSLRNQECTLALAGGVHLVLREGVATVASLSTERMFASDGRCKTFDAAADGFARSEGCGMVVLKRLSDAQLAGDQILAVIRGSMINQDGHSSGLTAPSGPAQQRVIQRALQNAGIAPDQVGYIEAHGTGTNLGDPIEIGALNAVFRGRHEPLWVGSVKTNFGHLEATAGIAGVMKVVLALQNGQIPPHLNFHTPNPYIDWEDSPIQIPSTLVEWPAERRVAGISSFGISGTNAHVVLSAAPEDTVNEAAATQPEPERPVQLFTLAAKSEAALRALANKYHAFLGNETFRNIGDLAYSTHLTRTHFAHRLALVADSKAALQAKLTAYTQQPEQAGKDNGTLPQSATAKVGFLFTGQGSQYVSMGRELYETSPSFRAMVDRCEELFQQETGASLLAVLYPGESGEVDGGTEDSGTGDGGQSPVSSRHSPLSNPLDDTTYTQPALFVLEVALATLWQSWGIQPDMLIGHSIGELAAACVAGVFSLEDGLKLVTARGRLMGALPQDGEMVSLLADSTGSSFEMRVRQAIEPYQNEVSIAAVNGPESIVIAGKRDAVLKIAEQLAADGVKTRKLTVSHAFHSPLMEPMLDDFAKVAQSITYHKPLVPIVSNITGNLSTDPLSTDPLSTDSLSHWQYWVRHVREAVRFGDGVTTLHEQGVNIFLEIGPKPVLLGMAGQVYDKMRGRPDDRISDDSTTHPVIGSSSHPVMLPSLRQGQSDWRQLLESLGGLYVRGVKIDWQGFDKDYQRHKVALPTYPFQRQRYWVKPAKAVRRPAALGPLLDKMIKSPAIHQTLFETALSMEILPFLADHRVYETVVAPGACHLAMVLSAAELAYKGASGYQLSDVIFPQALTIDEAETRTAQILLSSRPGNGSGPHADFRLISFAEGVADAEQSMATHATGRMSVGNPSPPAATLAAVQARCTQPCPLRDEREQANGMRFGPAFRWLTAAWSPAEESQRGSDGAAEVLVKLSRPDVVETLAGYALHPGLLDGCFQATALVQQAGANEEVLALPFALASLQLSQPARGDSWWCHVVQVAAMKWNLTLFDEMGQLVAEIAEFELRAASASALQANRLRTDWLYALAWQAAPVPVTSNNRVKPEHWLLVHGCLVSNDALIHLLQADGTPVTVVEAEETTALPQIVTEITEHNGSIGVLYCGYPAEMEDDTSTPQRALELCRQLLTLTQALVDTRLTVHLWIVTEGCQVVDAQPMAGKPASAVGIAGDMSVAGALWGFGRALAKEQPQLHPICLDLDASEAPTEQAVLLHQELMAGWNEAKPATEVAYRNGERYVAAVVPWQAPTVLDKAQPQRLALRDYGSLEHLHFVPLQRRTPGAGEIEVEVKAAGLNFRDVLNALGMLQTYYAEVLGVTQAKDVGLGFECAGVVSAVGAGVTRLQVGDRVMGTAAGTFAHYLTVAADQMVRIPEQLSDAEAATIPLAFLTAWYGLVELAKLQPGERVLIHAAAGGVGQAAVQIAQALGAEVIATASPSKWAFLEQQGIAHVFNSRTLDFAEEIDRLTAGAGVDVVFNSLNGNFIDQSFTVVGKGGRFVEIGKLGIWSWEQVATQRPDVAYFPYDLGEAMAKEPRLQSDLWGAVAERLGTGSLKPLPHLCFAAEESVAAFRTMQQAKHIGKVVLDFASPTPIQLQAEASYLITGGLGALGLQIVQQLVADGAKQLILTGRRGVTTDEQRQILAELAAADVEVHVVAADIANADEVQKVLDRCTAIAPLRGIVHTAGVLDDGIVHEQKPSRFGKVMAPKVDGSWHLHTLTEGIALDFFVCFSSAASLWGSSGQSNYAAANAFMDTLMQQRRRAGLPGLSINWGAWSDVGMAASLEARMKAQGMAMIPPPQGRMLFQHLLQQSVAQVGVLPLIYKPQMAENGVKRTTIRDLLTALPAAERPTRLTDYLQREIAAVLGLRSNTTIDPAARLFDFGLDSLMAVELKNKLQAGLDCTLRSTLLFDYPTLDALTPYLLQDVLELGVKSAAQAQSKMNGHGNKHSNSQAEEPAFAALSSNELLAFIAQEYEETA